MGNVIYFDTYAFYEMIRGNVEYNKFENGWKVVTTRLNLMELFYGLLLRFNKEIANHYYDQFLQYVAEVDDDLIKQAMEFRVIHKKKKLSYTDCIGYTIASQLNIPFVTGDEQFRNMANVTFLK